MIIGRCPPRITLGDYVDRGPESRGAVRSFSIGFNSRLAVATTRWSRNPPLLSRSGILSDDWKRLRGSVERLAASGALGAPELLGIPQAIYVYRRIFPVPCGGPTRHSPRTSERRRPALDSRRIPEQQDE